MILLLDLAEGVGFEPTMDSSPMPVFKTGAFNHSATLPLTLIGQWSRRLQAIRVPATGVPRGIFSAASAVDRQSASLMAISAAGVARAVTEPEAARIAPSASSTLQPVF